MFRGLITELAIDPPRHTGRTLSTTFIKERVNSLVLSLTDPGAFVAAVERNARPSRA